MILVNSGAFLSISSWFSELTEQIFVMIPYISSTGYPPKTQGIMGHVQVANTNVFHCFCFVYFEDLSQTQNRRPSNRKPHRKVTKLKS